VLAVCGRAWHRQTRVGLRDRALLLLGFAGAFRRSELVALDVADLEFSSAGLAVTLKKSKTDQEGRSRRIGIPYGSSDKTCPRPCPWPGPTPWPRRSENDSRFDEVDVGRTRMSIRSLVADEAD
jgi:hypothetical protein